MFCRHLVSRVFEPVNYLVTARARPQLTGSASEIEIGCAKRSQRLISMTSIVDGVGLMRNLLLSVVLAAGLILPIGVAQAQSTATVTATCKDGTAFTGTKRAGACRGHGGVQSWGEAISPANAPSAPGEQPASTTSQRVTPAPGGAGQVWVNTASKVYHCPGTRWYGKTKQGSYMSEAEARAQGARPDHGKACSS